ncbi:integrase core domain protein [Trichonephila inaurata madagascariensis]|uniref:Integrase core domain protein n=1 Tax=Trichonephila inaurata madagascariensis TaxID=2747483 RepID=A0A8X6XM54_9ARAC|nr:integrase core domain protein [Trichonephila inaurata madagascariensis]
MQVDWIDFRKGKSPLSAFVATLGFSRASYVEFVTNEKLVTLIECHKRAFEYFGGVPEEVLKEDSSYTDFLESILKTELLARQNRSKSILTRMAGFPANKTLDNFDYDFATGMKR